VTSDAAQASLPIDRLDDVSLLGAAPHDQPLLLPHPQDPGSTLQTGLITHLIAGAQGRAGDATV
jgi:hypothetical protein